jgi:hypothetical protein
MEPLIQISRRSGWYIEIYLLVYCPLVNLKARGLSVGYTAVHLK